MDSEKRPCDAVARFDALEKRVRHGSAAERRQARAEAGALINRCGADWKRLEAAGDPDAENAHMAAWVGGYLFLCRGLARSRCARQGLDDTNALMDALEAKAVETMEECLDRFSPEKGDLTGYLFRAISLRLKDVRTDDASLPEEDWTDDAPEDTRETGRRELLELRDALLLGREYEVLRLEESLSRSKTHSAEKLRWYQMFYTEFVTVAVQALDIDGCPGENRVFRALDLPYQDFYTARPCRDLRRLSCETLKPLGEICFCPEEERDKRLRFEKPRERFPAAVSLRWLGKQTCPADRRAHKGESGRSGFKRSFDRACETLKEE